MNSIIQFHQKAPYIFSLSLLYPSLSHSHFLPLLFISLDQSKHVLEELECVLLAVGAELRVALADQALENAWGDAGALLVLARMCGVSHVRNVDTLYACEYGCGVFV